VHSIKLAGHLLLSANEKATALPTTSAFTRPTTAAARTGWLGYVLTFRPLFYLSQKQLPITLVCDASSWSIDALLTLF
jgi:hypothetical protein